MKQLVTLLLVGVVFSNVGCAKNATSAAPKSERGVDSSGGAEGTSSEDIIYGALKYAGATTQTEGTNTIISVIDVICSKNMDDQLYSHCEATDELSKDRLQIEPHPLALILLEDYQASVKTEDQTSQFRFSKIVCIADERYLGTDTSPTICEVTK